MEVLGAAPEARPAKKWPCGEPLGTVAEGGGSHLFLCPMVEMAVIQPRKRRRAAPEARPAEKRKGWL